MLFEELESGFYIRLPLSMYARPAVIKALYRFHESFLISYEIKKENLLIYFDPIVQMQSSIKNAVLQITKELDFQMIRYDSMKESKEIRQLLIGRALYSTCIEPEDAECKIMKDRKEPFDWKTDSAEIFSGWKSEENE